MNSIFLPLAACFFTLGSAHAAVVISEIDLINNKVELVNTGSTAVNLTGYFICNRVSGSPFYTTLIGSLIDVANSTQNSLSISGGNVLTISLTAAIVPDANGEIGLYMNGSDFNSSANIVDYVNWGANGTRDSVAAGAGIWVDNTFVSVTGILAGQTIQLRQGLAGNAVADYRLAASTIGFNQVPEPGAGLMAGLGALTMSTSSRLSVS